MEWSELVAKRRMVRSFDGTAVEQASLDRVLRAASRGPSAGFTQGCRLVVFQGGETSRYWEATTTPEWRVATQRVGLTRAPVIVVVLTDPEAYATRYGEADKAGAGLDESGAWPVPYWFFDAGALSMLLLLAAEDEGLAACFLGMFRGEEALLASVGAERAMRVAGAVLIGHPDGRDHPSPSLGRGRLSFDTFASGATLGTPLRESGGTRGEAGS